jgi:hypothetical protein
VSVLEREIAAEQELAKTLENYADRWIAVKDQQVIADAPTLEGLLGQIKEAQVEVDAVFHVPEDAAAACFY